MLTRIHVNQQVIKRNRTHGENEPPRQLERRGRQEVTLRAH